MPRSGGRWEWRVDHLGLIDKGGSGSEAEGLWEQSLAAGDHTWPSPEKRDLGDE